MKMDCRAYKEKIAAHVDGALTPAEGTAVQTHLKQCSRCQRLFVWETQVSPALKQRLRLLPVNPALRQRISDLMVEKPREGVWDWSFMGHGLAAALVLAIIFFLPSLYEPDKLQETILRDAVTQYQKVTRGAANSSQATLSPYNPARLLDLSPWGYRLLSTQAQKVNGKEEQVFVYRGQGEEYLLALESEGIDFYPPYGGRVVRTPHGDLVSYTRAGVNLVAWKEKDLLCILASTLPKDQLLGLSRRITEFNQNLY